MENEKEVLAKNLIKYRKSFNLTQQNLADKLNYSDKAVSKWERAEGVPDVFVLKQIADIYNVKVDNLLNESPEKKPKNIQKTRLKKTIIITLSSLLVWLVATVAYVLLTYFVPETAPTYLIFVLALPATAIITLIFSSIWKRKVLQFLSITTLVWTVLLSIYLLFFDKFYIFLIGIPLQALEIFWYIYKNV
ncbi:MAG: helix-turn-helix domain-containing protein [Clostridia bacterium]|nr:helix-turn-helix domain-containing protein [Clostridia bacterium]